MYKAISAAEANRRFSELLRRVKKGENLVITSHGRPVAKVSPIEADDGTAAAARTALFARLQKERPVIIGPWTRDELYDGS